MNAKKMIDGILLSGMLIASSAMAMTEDELAAAVAAAESGGTVEVPGDVDLSGSLTIGKQLTIRGVGEVRPVIRRTTASVVFKFTESGDLTLENVIVDGNKGAGLSERAVNMFCGQFTLGAGAAIRDFKFNNCGIIQLTGTSHFVMEEGSELSGFENSSYGLAVIVGNDSSGPVFDMKGGIITGCHCTSHPAAQYADQYGGAVYTYGGTFNFSGGSITGNVSDNCVGGINIFSGAVYLSGTAVCTNNIGGVANDICRRDNGGTLYIASGFGGWATYMPKIEPEDAKNVIGVKKIGTTGLVAGFGRISCQTNSNLIFSGYYNNEHVYWATTAFVANGVPTGFWEEVVDFLKTGEDCLVEVFKNVLCSYDPVSLPATTGRLTLRGAGEGERVCSRCVPSGRTLAPSIISVANPQTTVRLENLVLDGAGLVGLPLASVTSGRLELGPGAVLRNASAYNLDPAAVNLNGANTECTMEEGAVIKDCESKSSSGYGAIVRIGNSSVDGSFKMSGGLITNCSSSATSPASSGYGGMVYVYKGVFEMTGGIIAGNVAEKSSAGVLNYNGTVRLGGAAIIENNVGAADDLYLYKKDSCTFFGDFRGRVGVSSPNQNVGETFRVRADDGATGAWCFKAIGADKGLIGKTDEDAADGTIVWAAPDGTVGGVSVASAEDAMRCLPKTMGTDEASRALLPISVSGVAKAASGTINVTFDPKDFLTTGLEQLTLIHSEDGSLTGKIAFTLSSGSDKWRVARRGTDYVLCPKLGMAIVVR